MMGIENHKKPSGEHIDEMVGPGAWPETDESVFTDRSTQLGGIHKDLTSAKEGWESGQSYLKSENNWAGVSATAANAKVDTHTKAMEAHEQQLTTATGWCGEAVGLISRVKEAVVGTVNTAVEVINDTISEAKGKNTDNAVSKIRGQAYEANKTIVQWGADTVSGKDGVSTEPPKYGKEHFKDKKEEDKPGEADPLSLFTKADQTTPGQAVDAVPGPLDTSDVTDFAKADQTKPGHVADAVAGVPDANDADGGGADFVKADQTAPGQSLDTNVAPPIIQGLPTATTPPTPGKTPPTPPPSPVTVTPTPPSPSGGAPNLSGGGTGGTGASGAPSPLSGGLGGSGAEQAASASPAAGQAPVGGAPTDPLQAFSKGFADSAGTPVHAASTGAPPLAPAPTVPASDAMAPASTHSAPTSLTGAQAPAAPVQGPPAGGSMGMGGGMPSMPLGPPPTAPPAAPVAPPPAVAPPAASPANIAGGAQIAPIPVSAARAERDAAQNAAKRSGSDPLELARRIAAALNAPGMVDDADFLFFWITALTVDGKIVVANNYGLAYVPEQVRLPEQVKMASADESIPPVERASWVNEPIVAVQRWAQHHGTELRAVIATANQLQNSDAGVHHEILMPEDIPPNGKMVGRDRLEVIAPQASSQLARISDADLVKVLPPASADVNPPEDRRTALWDEVWQPLASGIPDREERHLQAFVAYATNAQEQAIFAAHAAAQPEDQRRAVREFIYWQHVGQLIADAIAQ